MDFYPCVSPPGIVQHESPEMAVEKDFIWSGKDRINVYLMNGTSGQRAFVKDVVGRTWNANVGTPFVFVTDPTAEVRVRFDPSGGSWSFVGSMALGATPGSPTMVFGGLNPSSTDTSARIVAHEFGHAKGAVHEHVSPFSPLRYNLTKTYAYYANLGYSKAWVDGNVLAKVPLEDVIASVYDKTSIMHYAVPPEILLDPSQAVGYNYYPSRLDYETMLPIYGRPYFLWFGVPIYRD